MTFHLKFDPKIMCTIVLVCIVLLQNARGRLVNVALNKEAHLNIGARSQKAVDGDTNQYNYYICAATGYTNYPSWEVDLNGTYLIHSVKVFNRLDCCSSRLHDVLVSVSSDKLIYSVFDHYAGIVGGTFEFRPIAPGLSGRWVTISMERNNAYLTLCEVQVFVEFGKDQLKMSYIKSAVGNGPVIKTKKVLSRIQCAFLCLLDQSCYSVNIVQEVMSTPETECQFLGTMGHNTTLNTTISYWETEIDLKPIS